MYYLLGYRLLGSNDESIYGNQSDVGKREKMPSNSHITQRSRIFRSMNHFQRAQVCSLYFLHSTKHRELVSLVGSKMSYQFLGPGCHSSFWMKM